MARRMGFGLFFLTFMIVFGGLHYYVWLNLGRFLPGFTMVLAVLLIFLASAYPLSQLGKSRSAWMKTLGSYWLGLLSLMVVSFTLKDLVTLISPGLSLELPATLAALVLAFLAFFKAKGGPVVKRISIRRQGKLESLRIVHLSDLHLGSQTTTAWLEKVLRQVNGLDPDIVVITGDLIDDSFSAVEGFTSYFKRIKANLGIYAVAGNHEYYRGIDNYHRFCQGADIVSLDNRLVTLPGGVNLLGLDDLAARNPEGIGQRIQELLDQEAREGYNILLIHQPVGFPEAVKLGIDLQLSGHTHRGQFFPFNLFVPLFYRYAYGLYTLGLAHIYISSGTGTWGPPLRLGSDSEIVLLEVKTE